MQDVITETRSEVLFANVTNLYQAMNPLGVKKVVTTIEREVVLVKQIA